MKIKCECPEEGKSNPNNPFNSWYDEELELPFVDHPPGKCKCTNNLKEVNRNGVILTLCSICTLPGDIRL